MDVVTKPLPRITPDNQPFWDACRRHEFLLPWCTHCHRAYLPPSPLCPYCFEDQVQWQHASGRGVIASYVIVHQRWFPSFADDLPYNVVQVELEEGPRLTSTVIGLSYDALHVGLPVHVEFDEVATGFVLPKFRADVR